MLGELHRLILLFLLLGDGACGFGEREGVQTQLRARITRVTRMARVARVRGGVSSEGGLQNENEEKPVFIFATGRSGSTTVMRMLNTIPGAHICGETMGALGFLSAFYEALEQTRAHGDSVFPTNISAKLWAPGEFPAWSNSFKLEDALRDGRVLVRNLFKRDKFDTIWGSKDIRHHCKHSRLLKLLFPHARIIYHYRQNIEKQKLSAWYNGDRSAATTLAKENADLIKCHEANKDWTFLSNLEGRCLKFSPPSLYHVFGLLLQTFCTPQTTLCA
jgi:hypothetical protein